MMHAVKSSDVVLEVVDARAPLSTRSEKLEKLVAKMGKELVVIINKCDISDEALVAEAHKEILKTKPCIYVSAREKQGISHIKKMINMYAPKNKGNIKVSVAGYPNTGKSSIINYLSGRHAAGVAPVPGHTRGEQWIKVNSQIMLLDTPGVVPFGENIEITQGFGRPEKMKNIEDSTEEFIKSVAAAKYNNIKELYKLTDEDLASDELLELIAKRRGFVIKGGRVDVKRAAQKIILDWNTGKIKAYVD